MIGGEGASAYCRYEVREDLHEEVMVEKRPDKGREGVLMNTRETMLQVEGTISAKALRWERSR